METKTEQETRVRLAEAMIDYLDARTTREDEAIAAVHKDMDAIFARITTNERNAELLNRKIDSYNPKILMCETDLEFKRRTSNNSLISIIMGGMCLGVMLVTLALYIGGL